MSVRTFSKITSDNRELNKVQENVERAFSPVLRSQLLNGVLLENVELGAGNTAILHKLARRPFGYIIVAKNNAAVVFDDLAVAPNAAESFNLNSSVACVVSLWVF